MPINLRGDGMTGLKNVRNRRDDALARVGWDRLEVMLADYYRAQGWSVDHVGTGARHSQFDGGIDLKLRKDDQYVLVQCKHWNAKQVTHNAVHELLGIKVNEGATGAIVVTSGEFTRAARDAARRQHHVELIDGDGLRVMLGSQLEKLVASLPPELPRSTARSAGQQRSVRSRAGLVLGSLLFGAMLLYLLYRLLTYPMAIEIDLPQRTIPRQPPPPNEVASESTGKNPTMSDPRIEQGMSDAELEEWKRKNAESTRILEENERAEAQAAGE